MKLKIDVVSTSSGADPVAAATAARLRYVGDWQSGFSRKQIGKKFVYLDAHGRRLRDQTDIKRIAALVIPPAWTDVWICSAANGHLQATGRDARGRKQYGYHARWREVRDENKYERMIALAQAYPAIRASVRRDLTLPDCLGRKSLPPSSNCSNPRIFASATRSTRGATNHSAWRLCATVM